MPVLATKTEPRCKLCSHSHRPEIDLLLEKRSRGIPADDGSKVNEEYVLAKLAEWGVENPTKNNLTVHWKKHCELVDDEEAAAREKELDVIQKEMLAALEESDGSIDGDLEALRKVGMARIRRLVVEGRDPGFTNDHLLKAVAEQTKRSSNEAARSLINTLGAGLAVALQRGTEPKQIEAGEVEIIDAEVVEG